MEIQVQQIGAVTILKPVGPLAGADAEQVRSRAVQDATAALGRVVLDASDVPFLDSLGIESLLDIGDELARGGRSLKLCSTNETVRAVLDLTGVTSSFEFFEDVNAAVRSFL
jgi:anti-anti-sigma factor